jgi:hypothetical protein
MHHSQYFSFRSSIKGLPAPDNDDGNGNGNGNGTTLVKYVLANAGDSSYPSAWDGSTTFYSTTPSEPSSWKRKLDTTYDSSTGELSWTHTYSHDQGSASAYFAYFPPILLRKAPQPHLQMRSGTFCLRPKPRTNPRRARDGMHHGRNRSENLLDHSQTASGREYGRVLRGGVARSFAWVGFGICSGWDGKECFELIHVLHCPQYVSRWGF